MSGQSGIVAACDRAKPCTNRPLDLAQIAIFQQIATCQGVSGCVTVPDMKLNRTALRVIRERTGQSQTQTAAAAGIDRANYAHLEAGRRPGTDGQIVAIARALKIDVTAIIGDEAAA